jgi:CheY-like chemotaxis protein
MTIKENEFKLLVIDDEVELLETIVKQAKALGYSQVVWADNVDRAMEIIKNFKVDGILADVNMPQKDILNQHLSRCGIPVARVSGQTQRVVNFMLTKPFNIKQLKAVLDQLRMLASAYQAAA